MPQIRLRIVMLTCLLSAGLAALPGTAVAAAHQHARSAGQPGTAVISSALARQRVLASARAATTAAGSIAGVVVGVGGVPLGGACVSAIGPARSEIVSTTPAGRFLLTGLRPGAYRLEYRDCAAPSKYLPQWSGGAAWSSLATAVPVVAGHLRSVGTVTLRPASKPELLPDGASWRRAVTAASTASSAKSGSVTGLVTGGGRRLRGICVDAIPVDGGRGFGALTNKRGRYRLGHVPPGRYDIGFAGVFGCPGQGNWLGQWYRGDTSPFQNGARSVKVIAHRTTTGIDAKLVLGGEISGVVKNQAGKGLRGICIEVNGRVRAGSQGIGFPSGRKGVYHLRAVYPGTYTVGFSAGCPNNGNYAPQWWRDSATYQHLTKIKIVGTKKVTGVSAVLVPGAEISGNVTGPGGGPVPGICVSASDSDGSISSQAVTKADGSYQISGLGTGVYQVDFEPGCGSTGSLIGGTKTVHATDGQVTAGVDEVMVAGSTISGQVTNSAGKPVGGICVTLDGGNSALVGVLPQTGAAGRYRITGLSHGRYTIEFSGGCGNRGSYAAQWWDSARLSGLASTIALPAGQAITGINARLRPGGTLTGRVLGPGGRALTGVCVGVADPSGASFELGIFDALTFTDHGRYRLPDLSPGRYQINFGCGGGPRYAGQWFDGQPGEATSEWVSIPAGLTGGIDATLRLGGTISGTITDRAGHGLANVCIVPELQTPAGQQDLGTELPTTNGKGKYQISGLPAGRYKVHFTSCVIGTNVQSEWYRDATSERGAQVIQVRGGHTSANIDATITRLPAGSISGRVTGAAGNPLANICVTASTANFAGFGFTSTGPNGYFDIRDLASGRYAVSYSPCSAARNLVSVTKEVHVIAPRRVQSNARLVAGGSISGLVQAADPAPTGVAGLCVLVIGASGPISLQLGFTGAGGNYTAAGLRAGKYLVYFGEQFCSPGEVDLVPQWFDGKQSQAKATPVKVTVGQTTSGIDATLLHNGSITGKVTGTGGSAVDGACVTAIPVTGTGTTELAVSRAGAYTLASLAPGRYRIRFSSGCGATGYRTQWWREASSNSQATLVSVPAGRTVTGISAALRR